jgi:hypothetical protein
VKNALILGFALAASFAVLLNRSELQLTAQQPPAPTATAPAPGGAPQRGAPPAPPRVAGPLQNAPKIPYKVQTDFLKYLPDMNFGEVLGVAVNSKGDILVLNHPGTATSGPLYGNATTNLLLFDRTGKYIKEVGKGVYGLGYAHSVRYDRYDNLWVADKGTESVMKFNPQGSVVMNLGRRAEGYESHEHPTWDFSRGNPPHAEGTFRGVTDMGFDANDNIYVSDGYTNSRIAKFNKNGDWVKGWGSRGRENGQFILPHNLQVDRQGNVYVADRSNRRIQVFDSEGNHLRNLMLNVPYNKNHHPVLAALPANPANRPDETAPWALCITTNTPTQYLYAVDEEPGRLYKMTLDGKILGVFGESGRGPQQLNWPHSIACPSENEIFIADMNNWRVMRLTLP